MTRKEVIKWLESLKKEIGKAGNRTLWHYAEAIDIAIEALNDAEYIKLLQEHIDYQDEIIRKAVAKLKMGCTGCVHYNQQQTAIICRDCKRYHKDMYKER